MVYQIYPLKVGESVEPEPRILYLGNCRKMLTLYTYFWLIRDESKVILVDTGFNLDEGRKFNPEIVQAQSEKPLFQLQKKGLRPIDANYLILTHGHWDHLSPVLDEYTNAEVFIQEKELRYITNPPHPWFSKFVFTETVKKLNEDFKTRAHLTSGDEEVLPGIKVFWTGGHTPGHQSVAVDTREGRVIITGDVVFTYRNIEEDIPAGFNSNLEECFLSMKRIRDEADIILPNHDPAVLNRYGDEIG